MKITHVITRFVPGGADENTLHSCNEQARLGNCVTLVVGREWDPRIRAQLDQSVHWCVVPALVRPISPLNDILALLQLLRIFKFQSPIVVHTHTSKAGILGRCAAAMVGIPVVVHTVHIVPFAQGTRVQRAVYLFLERIAAMVTDAFVHVNTAMMHVYLKHRIGRIEKHHVVLSGMDVNRFRLARSTHNSVADVLGTQKIQVEEPQFLVLVSALETRKRQIEFLPIFAKIAEACPKAVLLLVGDGCERTRIENKISELGLNGRVILTGFRPDVERLVGLADVCLLTSKHEGLARVIVQYAAAACPIVSTDLPGIRQIVQDSSTGFLVPPDNLDSMVKPIVSLLQKPKLRSRISNALRNRNYEEWNVEEMCKSLKQLYETLTDAKFSQQRRGGYDLPPSHLKQ